MVADMAGTSTISMQLASRYTELVPSISHPHISSKMYLNVIFPCSMTSFWPLKKYFFVQKFCVQSLSVRD